MDQKLLASCGRVEVVKEYMMDAVVSASGSAPAYVYIMIEAMADAAVMDGMPRAKAYQLQHRLLWVLQRWFWKQENIRQS